MQTMTKTGVTATAILDHARNFVRVQPDGEVYASVAQEASDGTPMEPLTASLTIAACSAPEEGAVVAAWLAKVFAKAAAANGY